MTYDDLVQRFKNIRSRLESNEVLHRIGNRLSNRMKLEVTRLDAVDSGRLRASIGYKVTGNSLTVRAFGTNYAKYVEFGTKPSRKMARFLMAKAGESGGYKKPSKGVVIWEGVGAYRTARIKPRPYFYNTIQAESEYIEKTLSEYFSNDK